MIFCPICSTSGHRLNATPSRNDIMGEGGRGKSRRTKAEDDKVKPLLGFVVYCRLNYKKRITYINKKYEAPAIQKKTL